MSELVVLTLLITLVVLAVLFGSERAKRDSDATRAAAEGKAVEAEARRQAEADMTARAQDAQTLAEEIEDAGKDISMGVPRIAARWDHIRGLPELHEDKDDREADPRRHPP